MVAVAMLDRGVAIDCGLFFIALYCTAVRTSLARVPYKVSIYTYICLVSWFNIWKQTV